MSGDQLGTSAGPAAVDAIDRGGTETDLGPIVEHFTGHEVYARGTSEVVRKRKRPRPKGRMFARGVAGGSWILRALSIGVPLLTLLLIGGLVLGVRWLTPRAQGWVYASAEAVYLPLHGHRCNDEIADSALLALDLPGLVARNVASVAVVRAAASATPVRKGALLVKSLRAGSRTVELVRRSNASTNRLVAAVVVHQEADRVCGLLADVGLLQAPGVVYVSQEGRLAGPLKAGVDVTVTPAAGRATDIMLVRSPATTQPR